MDYRQNKKNNDDIKKKELNDLISTDGQIKRENIIEAENILFNNTYKNLKYDEYGFVDKNDNKKNENNSEEEKELSLLDMQKENAKLKEWLEITPYFENYMNKNKKKLKLKIRKGIPDSLRGEIWMKISGADKFKQGRENLYNELITKINKNELYQIPDEDIIPEWEQPDSTNAYQIGDRVMFDGKVYESLINNNVWSPAAYPAGWQEVNV